MVNGPDLRPYDDLVGMRKNAGGTRADFAAERTKKSTKTDMLFRIVDRKSSTRWSRELALAALLDTGKVRGRP